jgi:hypothetical protein
MRLRALTAAATAAASVALGLTGAVATAGTASATSYVCWTVPDAGHPDPAGSACSHQSTMAIDHAYNPGDNLYTRDMELKITDGYASLICRNGGYSYGLGRNVTAGETVWQVGTGSLDDNYGNAYGSYLILWHDGNFVHYHSYRDQYSTITSGPDWQSYTWNPNPVGIVQADGNIVVWSNGNATWASGTYHDCPGTEYYWDGYR